MNDYLVRLGAILFLGIFSLSSEADPQKEPKETYWQFSKNLIEDCTPKRPEGFDPKTRAPLAETQPQKKRKCVVKGGAEYWRIVATPGDGPGEGTVKIYDVCKNNSLIANANGDTNQWTLTSIVAGANQQANADDQGNLIITIEDGSTYGTGHLIKPMECKDGFPSAQIEWIVPPLPESDKQSSGAAHLRAAAGKTLVIKRAISPTEEDPEITVAKVGAQTVVCSSLPMSKETVEALTNNPMIANEPQIYPGNLLQGKKLTDTGNALFVSIPIKRAPGKITIDGINFKSKDAKLTWEVPEVNEGEIKQAINSLLTQGEFEANESWIAGTEAKGIGFNTLRVYSNEQMMFAMGLDARYNNVQFEASMKVDISSKKNYVLARYQQIYYTVSFEDPASPFDVFKEGEEFKDGWPARIGADNPPLYVKKVDYGRAIYFLASSEESAADIEAAFQGAYGNKDAGTYISANGAATFKKVMGNASVSYFALGGRADIAVGPINTKTPSEMFDKIKEIIADSRVSQVSVANRGVPIGYGLNYLISLAPAYMGYTTNYNQKDCTLLGPDEYQFHIEHTCVDDETVVQIRPNKADENLAKWRFVSRIKDIKDGPISPLDTAIDTDDKSWIVQIVGNNVAGAWCNHFRVRRTYINAASGLPSVQYLQGDRNTFGEKPHIFKSADNNWNVGNNSTGELVINLSTGSAYLRQGP